MRQSAWFRSTATCLCAVSFLMAALTFVAAGLPSISMAQDEPAAAPDEPAAEPAAAPAGGAASTQSTNTEEPVVAQSVLGWMWKALGPMYMLIFLGLSFTLVALFVMNLLTARRENVCPASLIEGFEAHLDEKQYQEAYELAKSDESFLGQVLSAGLAKLSAGYPQAIESMQEIGEEENMKLEHRLSYMALIGTLSPMVGLFGTVHGMIKSFQTIATGGSTPKAADLANGISTALFTTLVGLAIAIPALAAFNILKNRIQRLVLEVGHSSEELMGRFQNVGEK